MDGLVAEAAAREGISPTRNTMSVMSSPPATVLSL
jgi:hypothetical protein